MWWKLSWPLTRRRFARRWGCSSGEPYGSSVCPWDYLRGQGRPEDKTGKWPLVHLGRRRCSCTHLNISATPPLTLLQDASSLQNCRHMQNRHRTRFATCNAGTANRKFTGMRVEMSKVDRMKQASWQFSNIQGADLRKLVSAFITAGDTSLVLRPFRAAAKWDLTSVCFRKVQIN